MADQVASRDHASWLGHPRGLAFLVFTETWERFSFYGMQVLLVLYLTQHLLQPDQIETVWGLAWFRGALESVAGSLSMTAFATQLVGLYLGATYLTPIFGALLGDRWLGRRAAVISGASLMALGHFAMSFETSFLLALALILAGAGLLKANLAAQVSELYDPADTRRESAFTLYGMGINVGSCIAPLICGTLGETFGWHVGFGAAGVGMLIGLLVYLRGLPALRQASPTRSVASAPVRADGALLFVLVVLLLAATLFWIVQTQVWNTYLLWLRDRVDRDFLGLTVPVTWFRSLDSVAALAAAPPLLALWRWQARRHREPVDLAKLSIGSGLLAVAVVLLVLGEASAGPDRVGAAWPVAFHLVGAAAYVYSAPVFLAVFARAAPPQATSLLLSISYLPVFAGAVISGRLGQYYDRLAPVEFWLLHAVIVAAGALLLLLLRGPLRRRLQRQA